MRLFIWNLVVALSVTGAGAGVVQSATCISGSVVVTGTASCSAESANPGDWSAQASTTVTETIPSSPGVVTAAISGNAETSPNFSDLVFPNPGSSAFASADAVLSLYTAGPVRQGLALLSLYEGVDGGSISESVGAYGLGLCPRDLTCQLNGYYPFTLGQEFELVLHGSEIAEGFNIPGSSGFTVSASIELFDNLTGPVLIIAMPEPSFAVPIGILLGIAAATANGRARRWR
jgi:hypothetical protein